MARNPDGSVVLKTTGKVATTPTSGSGKAVPAPLARTVGGGNPKTVGIGNRTGPSGIGTVGPRKNYS